jgi:TolA-binding protein
MLRPAPSRWLYDPPRDDGSEIARLLHEESERPAPALDARAWPALEARLRHKRRLGRWGVLGIGLPVLAGAAGVVYRQREAGLPARAPVAAVARPAAANHRARAGEVPDVVPPAPQVAPAPLEIAPPAPQATRHRHAVTPPVAAARVADDLSAPRPSTELDAIEARAAAAQRAGDAQTAERGYMELARTSGLRAENALYELGLVRLHLQKDAEGALETWDEYRRRFPDGQLAPEVDLSRIAALERAGRNDDAVREGEEFLAQRPHSERAGEVHALVGSLLQQRGDCARALPHLDAGSRAPLPAGRADELHYRRALCLGALGHEREAKDAMRDYLSRFPAGRYRASVERALAE